MSDRARTHLTKVIAERESWTLTYTLKDEAGVGIPSADITALTLFLYNLGTLDAVNMGAAPGTKRDIKNANGGTVDATSGAATVAFSPDDMQILDATQAHEDRIALIEVAWNGGAKESAHEFRFSVRNMKHRPAVEP